MGKMKDFFHKINKNLILYSIILIVILFIAHFILKLFNLKFRQWFYLTVISITIVGILIRIIEKFIKQSRKVKKIIGYIFSGLAILGIIFWRIVAVMLFFLLLIINPKAEHVVERQGDIYVASVESSLLHTTVYFYEYVNFFVMGSEAEFEEHYKGAYDPIAREKAQREEQKENDTTITEMDTSTSEQAETEIVDPANILYEKEIRTDTYIRIVYGGSILGGRMGVKVQKTTDGGNSWRNQLKSSDGYLTVNNGAKFDFINENVGFINNLSLFILGNENDTLLVTVDGGESFRSSNFVFPLDIENSVFYIDDLPYLENGKLKVKLFASESEEEIYYEFDSVDNGLNWVCNK